MTTYTFNPNPTTQGVNWNDPSVWVGGVVPNSADANVIFPTVTSTSTGEPYYSYVTISSGQSYAVDFVSINDDDLLIDGSLSVANDLALMAGSQIDMSGGSLSVDSLENNGPGIQGVGQIDSSGILTNDTLIAGDGLTLTLAGLVNAGTLAVSSNGSFPDMTVNVSPGGFANLSGTTLTGGTYSAGYAGGSTSANTMYLNIGGLIVSDAANIVLNGGGEIACFASASDSYVPLESSLQSIASSGTLSLADQTYNWGPLTVDGALILSPFSNVEEYTLNATLDATQLIVDSDGQVSGVGTIAAPIANAGIIIAGDNLPNNSSFGEPVSSDALEIEGAVAGDGTLQIAAGISYEISFGLGAAGTGVEGATLELNGPVAENVVFSDNSGTLGADAPGSFSGTITPAGAGGDQFILPGVSLSSVTGYSYSGDSSGGTLTLQESGVTIALMFSGHFNKGSFSLSAGPQALSTSPPSLVITETHNEPVPNDFNGDGMSDMLWRNSNGSLAEWLMNGATISSSAAPTSGGVAVSPDATWSVAGIGDFTGSGNADILWRNANGSLAEWLMNGATIASSAAPTSGGVAVSPDSTWSVAGIGDFTGNGDADILWRNSNGSLAEWLMNGSTISLSAAPKSGGAAVSPDASWSVAGIGDFTDNGDDDILWRNSNGTLAEWLMNGATISSSAAPTSGGVAVSPGASWSVAGIGDFTGNGDADILWRNSNGALAEWLMNGTTITSSAAPTYQGSAVTPDSSWNIVEVGDFTGSGNADIIWQQSTTGSLVEWQMSGSTIVSSAALTSGGTAVAPPSTWQSQATPTDIA